MQSGTMGLRRIVLVSVAVGSLWSSDSGAAPRPAAAFQAAIPGLVAYWPLDSSTAGTVLDASGNGHTGTLTNGATIDNANFPAIPPGNAGSLLLNAVAGQQHVAVPDTATLRISGPITLAAWVRPTADTGTMPPDAVVAQKCIIEKWDDSGADVNGYFLRLTSSNTGNNTPLFLLGNGTTTNSVQGSSALPLNTWSHVTGVFDGTNMALYVGTTSLATVANSILPTAGNTAPLRLGKDNGANSFTGNIDEARVFNRALSAAEIGVLVNGQPPPTGLSATPGPAQIALSWLAAANATSYNVYRAPAAVGPWTLIASPSGTSYTDLAVTNPTTYWYRVTAVSVLESAPAGPVSAVPLSIAPKTTTSGSNNNLAHRCGCDSIAHPAGVAALGAAALLALAGSLFRRR